MKFIRNDIVKPFKLKILQYAECVCEMHDLDNYLPPHLTKGKIDEAANCTFLNQELMVSEV